jgi:hypothetical protein
MSWPYWRHSAKQRLFCRQRLYNTTKQQLQFAGHRQPGHVFGQHQVTIYRQAINAVSMSRLTIDAQNIGFVRPLDLLWAHHKKIEAWIREQTGLCLIPKPNPVRFVWWKPLR